MPGSRRHLHSFRNILVLDFDERAGVEYQRLRRSRVRIGTMDLKIAAIVLAHDATLLSKNLSDFRKVPGLKVADWTLPGEVDPSVDVAAARGKLCRSIASATSPRFPRDRRR